MPKLTQIAILFTVNSLVVAYVSRDGTKDEEPNGNLVVGSVMVLIAAFLNVLGKTVSEYFFHGLELDCQEEGNTSKRAEKARILLWTEVFKMPLAIVGLVCFEWE